MSSSHTKTFPPRKYLLAAISLLIGLLIVYGFTDLSIGSNAFNYLVGGIILLVSCGLTARILFTEFSSWPMTYWGVGSVLLVTALQIYLALKSKDATPCHITTAKGVILTLTLAGGSFVLCGLFFQLENYKHPSTGGQISVSSSDEGLSPEKITNLMLLTMLLLSLSVMARKFILDCW